MSTQLKSGLETTVVDIRKGGAGNPWVVGQIDATMTAPSGGGQSVESRWGRGLNGTAVYRGKSITSNPERVTGQMMTRLTLERFLSELSQLRCDFDLRVRYLCDNLYDKNNYTAMIEELDAFVTSKGYNENIATGTDVSDPDLMNQYDYSAGFEARLKKLRHDNISKTVSDVAFNDVLYIGSASCSTCKTVSELEYIAVTDQDATPGYASNPAPVFYFTTTEGATWSDGIYVDVFTSANASAVAFAGGNVLVASPAEGVAYANYQGIKDGAVNPNVWTLATGFDGTNGVNDLIVIGGQVVLAVGDGGRIWQSTDGGLSFTLIDNAATTSQDLNSIASTADNMAWIGGDSGTLLRVTGNLADPTIVPTISEITVQTSAGVALTANVNVVAVAEMRGAEPYLGTAGGQIWRSTNGGGNVPVFEVMGFNQTGNGQINDIAFAGFKGNVMFVVQTNANSNSRVLRDLSGGALGTDVEEVGTFTSPANNGVNAIAVRDENNGLSVGEVAGSYAFIGKLTA